ncbi:hypothetical protein OUZ56_019958 [Daphnia magna]|uniref:Uncharacterized protein n=1 Tax=Daphnia magna TaxID=35525 RepID=A0ABQ9ZD47_9CRUS|nr:hypothetical protein OUZ56_019958 [Daphnia magna]
MSELCLYSSDQFTSNQRLTLFLLEKKSTAIISVISYESEASGLDRFTGRDPDYKMEVALGSTFNRRH